ncbi:MAG TPA: ABC transporter permease [Anaerolineae bacterium]|jgi:peptide/nickel transport system permease protein
MSIFSFLLRRLAGMVAVMIGVSIITFAISHVIPADPVVAALGDHARDDQIAAFRAEYGLDQPVVDQYVIYVRGLLQGNLGISIRTRRPVSDDLRDFFPATLELSLAALLVSILFGIPAGILSSLARNHWPDNLVRVFSLLGGSLPIFWLGLILIGIFYSQLGWLPGGGRIEQFVSPPQTLTGLYVLDSLLTGNLPALQSSVLHLILPAFTLGYYSTAIIARIMRSSMLEVLNQDYIRTARAKGLRERAVVVRHGLRNALIPTMTIIGVTFGSLLSGAVLTETIFTWPGLGRYATASAINLDFPAVMGVTLLAAVVYMLANLTVDISYHWLDPRIQNG